MKNGKRLFELLNEQIGLAMEIGAAQNLALQRELHLDLGLHKRDQHGGSLDTDFLAKCRAPDDAKRAALYDKFSTNQKIIERILAEE